MQCLVERPGCGVEAPCEILGRHAVNREGDQDLALMRGQLVGDQASERSSGLAGDAALMRRFISRRPDPRTFGLELHGELTAASKAPADLGRRLALGEATRPGREEAVTAESIELGEDRDHGIIGSLDSKVVQIDPGRMGKRCRTPPDLEPGLTKKKRVETTNRLVAA